MVMSIDMTAGNDPIRQQKLANVTCYKCGQKGPNSAGKCPVLDQALTIPM